MAVGYIIFESLTPDKSNVCLMFKLTEVLSAVSAYIFKHATLILCAGYIFLGILVFLLPAELSRIAGIAFVLIGGLFGLFAVRKRKKI